ncbi:MAG: replication initiator protein [Microviridae sp.]|nr:MAG: replication initiator protein [Microviridae sp.]
MCLYPRLMFNPKYKANKKNGGQVPPVKDKRVLYVPIQCNKCIECRKRISRQWKTRLEEEIRHNTNGKFVTLTFSNKSIAEICEMERYFTDGETGRRFKAKIGETEGYERDNAIATIAVRRFLERWRKKYKKSVRHWLVTEIGHNGTENIHLHGIIWTDDIKEITRIWQYGYVWEGKETVKGEIINYVNEKTIGYITKYITKTDEIHTTYQSIILTSAGMGMGYTTRYDATNNKYKEHGTREYYRTRTGHKMALPIYWRNKIYTEEEREKLWIEKLDKEERYVCGEKVDISKGEEEYNKLVEYYRTINKRMGYSDGYKNYDKEQYEKQRRAIMQETRIKAGRKKIHASGGVING